MSNGIKHIWLVILWLAAVIAQLYYVKIGIGNLLRSYPGLLGAVLALINIVVIFFGFLAQAISFQFVFYAYHMRGKRSTKPVQISITDWPFCSILIPTYNEPPVVVEKTLEEATTQDYPKHRYEVLVIDDSRDLEFAHSTEVIAKKYGARYIRRTSRRGFKAGALNDGMKIAQGEYLLFLDSDSTIPSDALRKLASEFLFDSDLGYVQCMTTTTNRSESLIARCRELAARTFWEFVLPVKQRLGLFVLFCGHNGMVRRKAVEAVGGLNEEMISEDLDLTVSLRLKGWKGKFIDHIKMGETTPTDFPSLTTQNSRWAYGTSQYLKTNILRLLITKKIPLIEKVDLLLNCLLFPAQILTIISMLAYLFVFSFAVNVFMVFPLFFLFIGIICVVAPSAPLIAMLVIESRSGTTIRHDLKAFPLTVILFTSLIFPIAKGSLKALLGRRFEFARTPKETEKLSAFQLIKASRNGILFGVAVSILTLLLLPNMLSPIPVVQQVFVLICFILAPLLDLTRRQPRQTDDRNGVRCN